MEEEYIINWLKKYKDLISVSTVEKEAGIPAHTLQKVLQGKRHLPEKWKEPILAYLDKVTEKWLFPGKNIYKQTDVINWDRVSRTLNLEKRKRRNDYMPKLLDYIYHWDNATDDYIKGIETINKILSSLDTEILLFDSSLKIVIHVMKIERTIRHLTKMAELLKRDNYRTIPEKTASNKAI